MPKTQLGESSTWHFCSNIFKKRAAPSTGNMRKFEMEEVEETHGRKRQSLGRSHPMPKNGHPVGNYGTWKTHCETVE